MPYISERDPQLIKDLESVAERCYNSGDLNYVLTTICDRFTRNLKQDARASYEERQVVMGVLSCVQLEWYRRVLVDYEEAKRSLNGDVYSAALVGWDAGKIQVPENSGIFIPTPA